MEFVFSVLRAILPFEWAKYDFMLSALLAVLLVTPLFGLIGTSVVNNKMSFFSDALGHSALTGIAIGVLLGIDHYMISMVGFALLFALLISGVLQHGNSSADTVIGVFSSIGLALGIVILSAQGGFAKYSSYLIGDILTVQPEEILMLLILLCAVVILWILFYNKFLLVTINPDMASGKNVRVNLIRHLFAIVVALTVMVSIKWVGILIINSLLVLPAAASRNVAKSARGSHFWAIGISLFSGISGLILSYYLGTAASGTIVLIAAAVFFLTFLRSLRKASR
ncbi:MAG: metal ABC transporter permease [Clostridia bacterium]|nr:metal ABC transporter permease [Clostridia bacterium]